MKTISLEESLEQFAKDARLWLATLFIGWAMRALPKDTDCLAALKRLEVASISIVDIG